MRRSTADSAPVIVEQGKIMSYRTFSLIANLQWLVVLLAVFLLIATNFLLSTVPTYSMYPTLNRGAWCIGTYDISDLHRGDIVTFFPHTERPSVTSPITVLFKVASGDDLYIKRVMGLPGDTIAVRNGRLIVNGEILDESYLNGNYIYYDMDEITLREDEFFMMGDNRNNSVDSHIFGPIPKSHLCSKILWYISLPINWATVS